MLIVFGVATLGVLVEAFVRGPQRRTIQVVLALLGLAGSLVAVVLLAGTEKLVAEAAVAVDGPTLFIQGILAVLGILSVLLLAERSLDASGGSVVARAVTTPGSREDVQLAESREIQTEVFPL